MATVQQMKQSVIDHVEQAKKDLNELNKYIHSNPELSFKEFKASKCIVEILQKLPVTTTYPYADLETSFRADCKGELGEGPTVAILAEYDALPEIGHGCGHNLIATSALGAFLALVSIKDQFAGTVSLIGTPAEEAGGGKVRMIRDGAFDDVDFAMMIHPSSTKPYIGRPARACTHISLTYHGKSAHSSNPANGVDALSAMRGFMALLDLMRPTLPLGANVNSVIQQGGKVGNIICDLCTADLSVRGETLKDLEKIVDVINRCAKAASDVVGATYELTNDELYAERYSNRPMDLAFAANTEPLGLTMIEAVPGKQYGSSDSGNVSIVVPTIHEYIPISDHPIQGHTVEFTKASISRSAQNAAILAAKAMAMTTVDLLTDASLREKSLKYFEEQIPECYR